MPKSLLMSIYWVYLIIPCSAFVIYYLFELHSNRFHKLCIDHGEAFIKWRVKSHHESDPIIIEVVVRANMSIAEHVGNWRHRVGDSVHHWYLHNPNYGDVLIFGVDSGVSFIYYDNGQMNTVVGHTLFKENVIRKDNAAAYAKALTYNNTYVKSNDLFAAVFTDNYQSQIVNLRAEIAELREQLDAPIDDDYRIDQPPETPTDSDMISIIWDIVNELYHSKSPKTTSACAHERRSLVHVLMTAAEAEIRNFIRMIDESVTGDDVNLASSAINDWYGVNIYELAINRLNDILRALSSTSPDKNQVEGFVVHDGSYIAIGSKLWRDLHFGASPNTQYRVVKEAPIRVDADGANS